MVAFTGGRFVILWSIPEDAAPPALWGNWYGSGVTPKLHPGRCNPIDAVVGRENEHNLWTCSEIVQKGA